jgi:hypothetical protein
VSETLQQTVTKIDLQRKNAFRLLEVLVEAQAMTGKPLPFATRQILAGMKGSGKATKVAKQLAR